jgi:hypothetical protein
MIQTKSGRKLCQAEPSRKGEADPAVVALAFAILDQNTSAPSRCRDRNAFALSLTFSGNLTKVSPLSAP